MGGIGKGAKKVFGQVDPYATNSVDKDGNVVATGTEGAKQVMDPNHGLSYGNMLARGLVRGTGQGLQAQYGSQAQAARRPFSGNPNGYADVVDPWQMWASSLNRTPDANPSTPGLQPPNPADNSNPQQSSMRRPFNPFGINSAFYGG